MPTSTRMPTRVTQRAPSRGVHSEVASPKTKAKVTAWERRFDAELDSLSRRQDAFLTAFGRRSDAA